MSRGRPSKLTAEVQERIATSLRANNYFEQSVRAAGIHPATAYRWLEIGERTPALDSEEFAAFSMEDQILATANQPYREFREAVLAAASEAEVQAVEAIDKAGANDWRAKAWVLERRNPALWGGERFTRGVQELVEEAGRQQARQLLEIVKQVLDVTIDEPALRSRAYGAVLERLASLSGRAHDHGEPELRALPEPIEARSD